MTGKPAPEDRKQSLSVSAEGPREARRTAETINEPGALAAVLDSHPDIIFYKDLDGVYLGCNREFARHIGRAREAIVGKTDYDLYPAQDADAFRKNDRITLDMGTPRRNEEWISYPDGRKILLDTLRTPLRSATGKIIGIIGISRDITGRQQMEAEIAALITISRIIGSTLDIETVYDRFAAIVRNLIPFDTLSVNVIDAPQELYRIAYIFGLPIPGRPKGSGDGLATSMTGRAQRQGRGIIFNLSAPDAFARLYPDLGGSATLRAGFRSNLLVPLYSGNKVIAVLHFRAQKEGTYGEAELRLAERIGMQIAGAIANAILFDDLRKAGERLQESEVKLKRIIDSLQDAYFQADLSGKLTMVNPSAVTMYGYRSAGEMTGISAASLYADPRERLIVLDELRETGQLRDKLLKALRRDGTSFWVSMNVQFVRDEKGRISGTEGVVRNISDRKREEEEQRALAEIGRVIGSSLEIGTIYEQFAGRVHQLIPFDNLSIALIDPAKETLTVAYVSGLAITERSVGDAFPLRGTPSEPVVGTKRGIIVQSACPDDVTGQFPGFVVSQRAGMRSMISVPLISRDDVIGTMNLRTRKEAAYTDADLSLAERIGDQIAGAIANATLFAERTRAEGALQKQENLLQRIFAILPIGLWFADKDGTLLRGNPAGVKIWGAEPHVPVSEYGVFKAWRLPSREPVRPDEWALAKTIRPGVTILDELLEIESFDGQRKTILNSTAPVLDDEGRIEGAIVVNVDITDRSALENQLRQAQKMESVGRLAGGIAHDFNNMLGVIFGHLEMALEQTDPTQPLHADLKAIGKAAERSANLTRQLLAFARKQIAAPKVLDLNETVEGMLKMIRRLIGEDIDLAWLPGASLSPVRIDPSQVDQMLANLCINARDAIADVGKITIETDDVTVDAESRADHRGVIPGEFVLLAVGDNGCGMDEETRSHLFEPFFTTKGVGKGTGLGLATVYGIVQQNNGFIAVDSEPGQGTTFRIYLPRHTGKAEQTGPEAMPEPAGRGHETVLVVEDEPDLLELNMAMLEKLGYRTLGASTPREAIRLAEDHAGGIHLLLTDVVMPEMNGRNLAGHVLARHPEMKCLFMSGYTADVIAHRGILDDEVSFIQKPFSRKELAAKVREVLDRA